MGLRLAVTGANGRMGRAVLAAASDRDAVEVVLAVNRSPVEAQIGGVAVDPADDLDRLLADRKADVLVDFTGPESAIEYATACADRDVAFVTGTTGFGADEIDALEAITTEIPLLRASNFSRGVAALRLAVREAVAALDGYDIELTETHHNGKRDAPSGTAKTILADVEAIRSDLTSRVHGREGDAPRTSGEIGVHARRAGDVAGEHEVLLAGNNETVTVSHRAGDRSIFAIGAIDAAEWIVDRAPGRYDFFDVIDED
ncbi:MAG: 4-hydroxy-tetrahydrodipicolinate reductase [Halobacteriota archaeon]